MLTLKPARFCGTAYWPGDDDLEEMTLEVASGRLPKEQVIEFFVQHVVEA